MEDLKNVYLSPLPDSPYVKPFRFNYTQNGKPKNWDLLEVHASVAIIVFNVTRNVMVFVKQFRPAIYYNCIHPEDRKKEYIDTVKYPASLGIALEMCAGIVDKDKPIEVIAAEEVLEECGYEVKVTDLEKVTSYRTTADSRDRLLLQRYQAERAHGTQPVIYGGGDNARAFLSGVGVQGALQTMYYVEVTDDMKTKSGGGVDDEIIDLVEMAIPEIEEMLKSPGPLASPPSCLFALMWFLHHKAEKFRKSAERDCYDCMNTDVLK